VHDSEVVGKIVNGVEGGGERFAGLHEVAEVGARVAAADGAGAGGVGRRLIFSELFVLDVEAAFAGEEKGVARGAGGKDTVHHVDAHAGVLLDLVGVADSHDVAGLVFGQERENFGDDFESELARFADAEAADGVAVEVHCSELLGALAAKVAIHAALDDTKKALGPESDFGFGNIHPRSPRARDLGHPVLCRIESGGPKRGRGRPHYSRSGDRRCKVVPRDLVAVGAKVRKGAAGPGHGETEALFGASVIGGVFGALVEGHDDVGAERDLNIDRMFGGKGVRTSVEMGAELDSFFSDSAQ